MSNDKINQTIFLDYLAHLIDRAEDVRRTAQDLEGDIENSILNPLMEELSNSCHALETIYLTLVNGECPECECDKED